MRRAGSGLGLGSLILVLLPWYASAQAPAGELERAEELTKRAWKLYRQGKYQEAVPLDREALAIREQLLGPEHPDTAAILNQLALTMKAMGDRFGARPLYERALAISEKVPGPDHPTTAVYLGNLASLLQAMGLLAEARPLHERALAINEKFRGPDHPVTAANLFHLAGLRTNLGELAEAQLLLERALAIREKAFGLNHPTTALSMAGLARLLRTRGKLAEARSLFERALAINEQVLGPHHPATAASLRNLASLMQEQGKLSDARPLFERALAIDEQVGGPHHPATAASLDGLGWLLQAMGKLASARPLLERALAINEQVHGPDHPVTATSLNHLGVLLRAMGDLAGARPLHERALAIHEKAPRPDHLGTTESLSGLALLLWEMGDLISARPLFERALAIKEKVLGPDHPDTAASLHNLGTCLLDLEDPDGARPLLERALAIEEEILGPDHPHTAASLSHLARVLQDQGDPDGAETLHERALAIREEVLEPDHPHIAWSLTGLADLRRDQGDLSGAHARFERALAITEKALGPDHPHTATILYDLALLLIDMGRHDESRKRCMRSLEVTEQNLTTLLDTLSEREGIELVIGQRVILDAALSILAEPADAARTYAAILSWKAAMLGVLARRQEALRASNEPAVRDLRIDLRWVRAELSQRVLSPNTRNPTEDAELDRLRQRKEQLERALALRVPGLPMPSAQDPATPAQVCQALPPGWALVDLVQYDRYDPEVRDWTKAWMRHYAAFLLREGPMCQQPLRIELGPAQEIEDGIFQYRNLIATRAGPARQAVVARWVRERVWDPIAARLGPTRQVWLVPDGALDLLPFAALAEEDGTFLGERYLLAYLASARELMRGADATASTSSGGALVLGGIDFGKGGPTGAPRPAGSGTPAALPERSERFPYLPLPGSQREARAVAELLGRHGPTELLEGRTASEEAVKSKAAGRKFLHFATHGFFARARQARQDRPLGGQESAILTWDTLHPLALSGLALAGVNEGSATGRAEDGLLTGEEVLGLELQGTELVVLSACDTGLGSVQAGEGVLGLQRAFSLAGARALVLSLWKVPDDETAALMTDLYTRPVGSEPGAWAKALAEAQRCQIGKLRQAGRDPDPLLWAAFIVSGR